MKDASTHNVEIKSSQAVAVVGSQETTVGQRLLGAKVISPQELIFGCAESSQAVFGAQTRYSHRVDTKHKRL